MGKIGKCHFMSERLARNEQTDRRFMFMKIILPQGGCLPLPQGYIHVYDQIFKHLLSGNRLAKSKPNFYVEQNYEGGLLKVFINGQGHMTKMAAMAINSKSFKTLLLQNQKAYDFETWHEASWNEALLQNLYN